MTTELRDGLARALLAHDEYTGLGFIRDREKAYWLEKADAALAFIQQHNDTAERLAIAERALVNHGYRKSCDIPACNCGNQWTHGGHAVARLSEIDDATGDHLFLRLNPQCEVFDNMPGLMTQFDNYIAGQLQDIAAEKAARERAEQEVVRLREALIAVDEWDLNWADGLDANVEKIKSMARAALEG